MKEFLLYPIKGDKPIPRQHWSGASFTIKFDNTDHFWFECPMCKKRIKVTRVFRDDYQAKSPTVYFYMECRKCGQYGQRKIYLKYDKK